jgi:hypothetical protein
MNKLPPNDDSSYVPFTAPARRDKALHTLLGFLDGIAMDQVVNLLENRELEFWLREYESLATRDSAFSDLVRRIHYAMADGRLQPEEIDDIKHWCGRMDPASAYYAPLTQRIQELHGILHGVVADTAINDAELGRLQEWLDDAGDYRKYWPIGEVETAVTTALRDGRLDATEHRYLLRFFASFGDVSGEVRATVPQLTESEFRLEGVCATDPEIEFERRSFCFTGGSEKYARTELVELIHKRGGLHAINVRQDLDYLVVCDGGNPCWAFASYGRKVEKVMEYRKTGYPIVVVRERDFLDATRN